MTLASAQGTQGEVGGRAAVKALLEAALATPELHAGHPLEVGLVLLDLGSVARHDDARMPTFAELHALDEPAIREAWLTSAGGAAQQALQHDLLKAGFALARVLRGTYSGPELVRAMVDHQHAVHAAWRRRSATGAA